MKDNIEKLLKRFLKRKVKITVATTVTFLLTGIASYSEEIKLTDTEYQKYFFSKVEKDNKIKGILNFFGIIEKQKYDTYSSSKMLERWDKYDPTGNYEENPVKNTEKNIISKKENDKKISNNGEITGDRTQLNNTIEISTGGGILIGKSIVGNVQNQELIAINGLDNSISNISKVPEKDVGNNGEITEGENIGNINKDSIKVDPDKKEEIEIEGGNISSEDVNEVGTTGDSGKNGANGNEGGRYEHGEAGGSGTNGGSVTGKKDITINKDNITVTGGQGGLGGTGGKGGDDWGHGGNAGTGGAGGNGGIGGSATGIQTNGDITNIGDITVIAGIGGTGGTGGNGGDDKYTHTWGGKGGTGGDGGTAIGIETSDGTIKNQGSIIAIGGNAGTGGQGGHWGGNKGPDAEDGKNGINGNGIGIKGDNNTIFNEGTLIGSNTAVSGNNNNITNIGIIGTGTGNDIITGTGNNLINAGVTVKVDNTGKITSIIESSENTKVEINGKNYTSIHMKNEIGNQSNKIINATNDTKHLIIGQDTTIKDSIVNGVDYDNASIIVNKGTTKIEGTTINSLNDNAIKINDETTLIFSGSFADGNIDLSNGNNSLIFSNGSSLTGKIETGTGNNELIFDKAKYELELDLSKGNDNITIKNGSLLGEIKLGEGNNKVVIENAEYNKNLDMTKGDDELYLQNGGIYTGKIDFGEGNNKLIINNTSINNNFDLANGNNEIKTINTILEGNLTAGTGNDTLTANTSIIKGDIALGEGLNNIDLTNSGIEGSITTGSGDDIFNIISSVVKGNLNTGDGNNQITISGSNMGIEGNITAGTGDDTFKLTENGIVTGNVDLGTGSNTANITGEIGGNLISKGSTSIIDLVKGKIFGNIELGDGLSNLTMKDGSGIKGNVTATGSKDNVFDLTNSTIGGKLEAGSGNNTITLKENSGILNGIVTGTGNDTLTANTSVIKGDITLGEGLNNINLTNSVTEGSITTETGDDILTANTSVIKGDITLGEGLNNIDLTNSGIEGSITTGSGDDIFNIISSVVKGNLNTGDGNNQITISGSNMGIEGNITAGTGDDTFKLTENGIVTGNVDLGTGSNTANITGEIGGNLISKGSTSIIDLVKGKIFGNIELGDGLSNLTMKDGSGIKGNVTATGSKDNVFDLTNSTIGGKLEAGSGNNTITLKENSGILNGIVTGTGNDTLTANTSVIKGDIALGEGLNNIQGIDSILIGNIITGNDDDEISYTNTYHKGNINLENGNNTISLKENSIISGNVVVGNDNDTITLSDSQIQGNIDLKNGDNILNVDSKSYIFGAITAGTGNDNITLETDLTAKNNKYFDLNITLGNDNSNEINNLKIGSNNYLDGIVKGSLGKDNIMIGNSDTGTNIINLELSGIENVTLQGNTKISANSKLYADKITVTGSGDTYLELDVDINKNAGIHTGHGLYGNTGIYETLEKDSHLIIDTSKINNNSIIDITGDLKIENDQLKSDSLIHSVFKNKDGDIEVIVDHSLPPINGGNGLPAGGIDGSFIRYDELNQVYQSIYTAGKIGYLAQDVNLSDKEKDEAFKSLLSFLNQIYANNIYGYAPKLSIDSMDLYKKSILNTSNKLSKDDVLVKGTFLYAHREKQNDTHGRNFYGWDNGIERFNVSTNTEGLMTSIEKGLTENQTIGIDFGASKQQSKISNSSTLDANSLYLGVHNIYEKGMFKAVFGVGMQTNMYEGERVVKTKYSFSKNNTDFSTLSHNIYLDTSYNFKLNNNVSLIPYYDFTTNIVHMESIKENYTDSSLAISTDKEKVFVIENEIGLKVQTEALTDNTKYKMSAGIAYINRSGNTDYDLKGRIVGGSDFTILGENIEHNNIKGDINFDVEQENGIFYNLNLSAEYGEKERTTYKAQLGLGYKF